ncbi:hypothetical protein [Halopiger aswanensis]|uniref:Uncharacterized protein n=1 Tax=Halopiger aswanensis TaxID=148449 RepID=A0A3R7EH58_9EURY|nr:hypothetical protein [Halopiger aswanensis]RKD97568.1 hypothetical protein ATJ93_0557 [Halopiger aswanensis]
MPSRRTLLAATGSAVASGIAGCLSRGDVKSAELLQLKAISVRWRYGGTTYSDQILDLRHREGNRITGRVAAEYAGAIDSLPAVTVSDDHHERLEAEFETVRYVLGLCGDDFDRDGEYGCRNTGTARADFNRVQFGDRADVVLRDDRFDVQEVHEGDDREWSVDIDEFEWRKDRAE